MVTASHWLYLALDLRRCCEEEKKFYFQAYQCLASAWILYRDLRFWSTACTHIICTMAVQQQYCDSCFFFIKDESIRPRLGAIHKLKGDLGKHTVLSLDVIFLASLGILYQPCYLKHFFVVRAFFLFALGWKFKEQTSRQVSSQHTWETSWRIGSLQYPRVLIQFFSSSPMGGPGEDRAGQAALWCKG